MEEKPELAYHLNTWYETWLMLSCFRPNNGFGIMVIPFTTITAYLDEIGLTDPHDRHDWIAVISRIDSHYVHLVNKQQQAKSKRKS